MTEAEQAIADRDWWDGIFKPLGCTLIGWTYRNTAQVRLPSGDYLSIDRKIMELLECAKVNNGRYNS